MNALIKKATGILSIQHNISENELTYIGYTDCSFMKDNGKLFQFNIVCPGHECDKSTVSVMSWKM